MGPRAGLDAMKYRKIPVSTPAGTYLIIIGKVISGTNSVKPFYHVELLYQNNVFHGCLTTDTLSHYLTKILNCTVDISIDRDKI
jgi:hypothetical protein